MTNRNTNHEPALTLPEAAMLPAMGHSGYPTMPLNLAHFRPVKVEQIALHRQGSAAGRAILHADNVYLPGVRPMGCHRRKMKYLPE